MLCDVAAQSKPSLARASWCRRVVSPQRDRVAVLIERARWAYSKSFGPSCELVATGREPGPAFMGGTVMCQKRRVADGDTGFEVGETSGGCDLASVGVGDIGVPAPSLPRKIDHLLSTDVLADDSPVFDGDPNPASAMCRSTPVSIQVVYTPVPASRPVVSKNPRA